MPENRHFVRSTNLSDKAPALIGGSPSALSYRALIDKVEALAGREAASLFAEPVLPHKAASRNLALVRARVTAASGSPHLGNNLCGLRTNKGTVI